MEQIRLQVWDYLVCGLLLAATFSIGIYYAVVLRKRSSVSEYLFASGTMSFIPIALSITASFESTVMMLGVPSEAYSYGTQYTFLDLGYSNGLVLEQILLLSFVRSLNLVSPFEYLELRFKSRWLRLTGTVIGCFDMLMYMSVVLYGQAVALQAVMGFSMTASTVISAAAAVIYTSIGGLRAVVWTDVLQIVFITGSIFVFLIKGTLDAGGMSEVWRRSTMSGRFDVDTDPDITVRHNLYVLLLGTPFLGFGLLFKPVVLQRVTAVKSTIDARRALMITYLCFPLINALALLQGLISYSYFDRKRCDPVAANIIDGPNQIVPFMTMEIFRHLPGLSGLFLAGLFSATLSTVSSCLSALANISFEDFIKPCFPNITEFRSLLIAKISVVLYGVIGTGLALLVSLVGRSSINQIFLVLTAITRSPGAGMIYLGLLFPFVDTKSAFSAFLAGVSFLAWLVIGAQNSTNLRKQQPFPPAPIDHCPNMNASMMSSMISPPIPVDETARSGLDTFYSISYGLYGALGFLSVMVVGVVLGLATGGYKKEVDLKYVLPFGRKLHTFMHERLKIGSGRNRGDINRLPEGEAMVGTTVRETTTDASVENDTLI